MVFIDTSRYVRDSDDSDKELVALGYQPSFKREFTNLATVSSVSFIFAFKIIFISN